MVGFSKNGVAFDDPGGFDLTLDKENETREKSIEKLYQYDRALYRKEDRATKKIRTAENSEEIPKMTLKKHTA